MQRSHLVFVAGIVLGSSTFAGCNRDHNPAAHHQAIKDERLMANRPVQKLSPEGKLPEGGNKAVGTGNVKYDTLCASCHGVSGKADSAVAGAMNPKPRNFSDKAWQSSVDDARIVKVIKEGGASVGLSPTMAAWGSLVNDQEAADLVKLIRSFQ